MTAETLPPPSTAVGPRAWLRDNLFSGPINSIITILLVLGVGWVLVTIAQWAIAEARWSVISVNLRLFLIGQYPPEQAWRIWLALALLSVLGGL